VQFGTRNDGDHDTTAHIEAPRRRCVIASPRRLPDAAREWIARAVGDGARIEATRRLRGGGGSSDVRAVVVIDRRGRRLRLVLRRYINAEWLASEPDLAAREARILRHLAGVEGVLVPEVVAVDEDGHESGAPSVLVTLLPGRLDLMPRDERWFAPLAALLPPLHAAQVPEWLQPYAPYTPADHLETPSWTRRPEAWARAIAIVRARTRAHNHASSTATSIPAMCSGRVAE
jgi:hypothetical protein